MRFASLNASSAGNYAAAGKAVVNETSKVNKAAIEAGVDFGKLAIDGMKARSYEKRAAMKAEAHVAKAGLNAASQVKKTAIAADAKVSTDKSKLKTQMAGRVAAMGDLLSKGVSGGSSKRRPTEPSNVDYQQFIDQAGATADKYSKKADDIRGGLSTNNKDADVPETGSPSTPATGSNFFTTGDTGIGTGPHLDARVWSHKAGGWVKPTGLYEQYITGPDGQSLSDYGMSSGYGHRDAPTAGASTFHVGEDWRTPSGTRLTVNLPQVEGHHGRKFDSGGGWMSGYRINDDLELHLMHGQQLETDRV